MSMVVAVLVLELRLEGCRSLKDKRHLIRGPIERARNQLHVGIAEVGDQELWGNAEVCAAVPSNSVELAETILTKVERLFDEVPEIEIVGVMRDLWRPC